MCLITSSMSRVEKDLEKDSKSFLACTNLSHPVF
jgi:hypothetical protein